MPVDAGAVRSGVVCLAGTVRSTGVHHVDLVVSSILRSLPLLPGAARAARLAPGRRGGGRARRDDLVPLRPRQLDRAARGADVPADGRTTATASGCTTSRSRRRRAQAVDERADWLRERGAEIESGPEEYSYVTRLLRRLLLRPGRDQARDRPRPGPRRLARLSYRSTGDAPDRGPHGPERPAGRPRPETRSLIRVLPGSVSDTPTTTRPSGRALVAERGAQTRLPCIERTVDLYACVSREREEGVTSACRYARAGSAAGSNLSFASRRSAGTRVGYSPVRHARQSAEPGRRVDASRPSSER